MILRSHLVKLVFPKDLPPPKLLVFGAAAIDITGRVMPGKGKEAAQVAHTTAPGMISLTVGGVARNIAEAAHRMLSAGPAGDANATLLVSPVGDDEFAPLLLEEQTRLGMRMDGLIRMKASRTAVCDMVLDTDGGLVGGVADMDINHEISEELVLSTVQPFVQTLIFILQVTKRLEKEDPSLIALDGNLSSSTLTSILSECWKRENLTPSESLRLLEGLLHLYGC